MEASILPIFEVELDLANSDPPIRKAEVDENSGVHLRCKVKGDDHDPSSLHWIVDGSELSSKDGILVETDHANYVSNLKMNPAIGGFYECSVSSKTDGRYHRTRLRVTTKPAAPTQTIFGEVLCGPEKEGYCQHGGTCLYHPGTKAVSCRCPKDAAGPQCEYMLSGLHKFPPTRPPLGPSKECEHRMIEAKEEYQKSVILVAGIAGFLILALLIAFFLYVKKRYFRDQIKAGCSPRRRNKNFNNPPPETIISQPADHLLQEEQSVEEPIIQIPPFRPSPSMEEKIKLIKALVPARCPHCKKTLGINAKLDALSVSSRSSTPPLLTYTARSAGVRSISESHFQDVHDHDANTSRFYSSPGSYLRVSEYITPRTSRSTRERHRGVSESADDHLASRRRSVSTPVSPVPGRTRPTALSVHQTPESHETSPEEPNSSPDRTDALDLQLIPRPVTGIIQEMSVDESGAAQDSTALLDALQAYRAQNKHPLARA